MLRRGATHTIVIQTVTVRSLVVDGTVGKTKLCLLESVSMQFRNIQGAFGAPVIMALCINDLRLFESRSGSPQTGHA
jgi:hypothetical protein